MVKIKSKIVTQAIEKSMEQISTKPVVQSIKKSDLLSSKIIKKDEKSDHILRKPIVKEVKRSLIQPSFTPEKNVMDVLLSKRKLSNDEEFFKNGKQTKKIKASLEDEEIIENEKDVCIQKVNDDDEQIKDNIAIILNKIESVFLDNADSKLALKQTGWMRNQVAFIGISTPVRRNLQKSIFNEYLPTSKKLSENDFIQLLKTLFQKEQREFHYAAIDIAKRFSGKYSSNMLDTFEWMIRHHSWWDSVDDIATNLVGPLNQKFPKLMEKMDNWISDDNLWIRRTAILFQLKWKTKTDKVRLEKFCTKAMKEREFFIEKALGWALRDYAKTNKQFVRSLLEKHDDSFSPLTKKEAGKYL